MGGLFSKVGTSIATAQVPIMGDNNVKLPVSSIAGMIPVSGARTTAVKNAAIPTIANSVGRKDSAGSN
jgi:hypothetical protein